ncbi:MAG: hypothetical protein ACLQO7_02605 [Candidatus Bathyarchaeia archaeon]
MLDSNWQLHRVMEFQATDKVRHTTRSLSVAMTNQRQISWPIREREFCGTWAITDNSFVVPVTWRRRQDTTLFELQRLLDSTLGP